MKTVRTERLKIATFGDQNQELEAVNLVELSLTKSGTDFKTILNAFAVPHICNDLQGQDLEQVKKRYPSLKNIEFADVCPASTQIGILEAFEKNLSFEDGKYLVHLPWKEQHELLPDNFENCVARLSSQLKRLRKDPEIQRS